MLRAPSESIRQWDRVACETACTAQLLYIHGKLNLPLDTAAFDQRIGRRPNQYDLESGNLRVLFEEGFEIVEISAVNRQRIITDIAYVRELYIADGDDPEQIDAFLAATYPSLRLRTFRELELINNFAHRHTQIMHPGTWRDITTLIENGYHVSCDRATSVGTSHQLLITHQLSDGQYQLFEPGTGLLSSANESSLAGTILPYVTGYRLVG